MNKQQQQQQQQQMKTAKPTSATTKSEPQFGRPLIPYFLEGNGMNSNSEDQFQVNTELCLPKEHETMQRELVIPKGEKSVRIREFKDGYFEYKELNLKSLNENSIGMVEKNINKLYRDQERDAMIINGNSASSPPQSTSSLSQHSSSPTSKGMLISPASKGRKKENHFENYKKMVTEYSHYNMNNSAGITAANAAGNADSNNGNGRITLPNKNTVSNHTIVSTGPNSEITQQQQQQKKKARALIPVQAAASKRQTKSSTVPRTLIAPTTVITAVNTNSVSTSPTNTSTNTTSAKDNLQNDHPAPVSSPKQDNGLIRQLFAASSASSVHPPPLHHHPLMPPMYGHIHPMPHPPPHMHPPIMHIPAPYPIVNPNHPQTFNGVPPPLMPTSAQASSTTLQPTQQPHVEVSSVTNNHEKIQGNIPQPTQPKPKTQSSSTQTSDKPMLITPDFLLASTKPRNHSNGHIIRTQSVQDFILSSNKSREEKLKRTQSIPDHGIGLRHVESETDMVHLQREDQPYHMVHQQYHYVHPHEMPSEQQIIEQITSEQRMNSTTTNGSTNGYMTPPSVNRFKSITDAGSRTQNGGTLTEEQLLASLYIDNGNSNSGSNSSSNTKSPTCEKPASAKKKQERFAGGSWSNSPPPSSLPTPKFSSRLL